MIRKIALTFLALLSILMASCATDTPPQTDTKAPDFELYDTSGKAVRLSDYKGQAVLINFWDTACTYCVEEMPLLQQAFEQESASADGAVILTVNIQDSAQTTAEFMSQNQFTLTALVDSGGKVTQAYGVSAIPITFLIDQQGIVRYIKRGLFSSINEVNLALKRVR